MEITKELKQDLSELESACSSFLGKYESQLTAALNKAEMSAEELCAAGKKIYTVLSEDMEQLQSCEYIFQEDAMWLRYGSKLHEELRDHRLQKLLDEEIYCEDESGMQ